MAIACLASLGFVGATLALALAGRSGFVNALAGGLSFAFTDSLSFVNGFALIVRPGFFNIFTVVYISCLANTLTFADMLPLAAVVIITSIARNYICRCPIAAIKQIRRSACEMCSNCIDVSGWRSAIFVSKAVIHHLDH